VPALQTLPGYELKAVCTAHEETAKQSAQKFGAELAFHDMDEMVAHPDIDLITVVVRVPWHKQLIMPALQSGKSDAPDFNAAVVRHALIDAMERSHHEGKVIQLA
jgi:predicted dehydrogenase